MPVPAQQLAAGCSRTDARQGLMFSQTQGHGSSPYINERRAHSAVYRMESNGVNMWRVWIVPSAAVRRRRSLTNQRAERDGSVCDALSNGRHSCSLIGIVKNSRNFSFHG